MREEVERVEDPQRLGEDDEGQGLVAKPSEAKTSEAEPAEPEPSEPELVVHGSDPEAEVRIAILPIILFFSLAPAAVALLVVGHALLRDLPWYRTELAVLGWVSASVIGLCWLERWRVVRHARQGRAELFDDRIVVYKKTGSSVTPLEQVTGYLCHEAAGYVALQVDGRWGRLDRALPAVHETERVALLDWLDRHGLERKM